MARKKIETIINEKIRPFSLNEKGHADIARLTTQYSYDILKECIDIGVAKYFRYGNNGLLLKESVDNFLNKLGGIAHNKSLPPIEQEILRLKNKGKYTFSYWKDDIADEILHDYVNTLRVHWTEQMVVEDLKCNSVVNILETDVEENIFSPEFVAQLDHIKLPATKLEVLVKLLRKSIKEYKNTNKIAAEKYEELLRKTLEEYHNRRAKLTPEEASQAQNEAIDEIIKNATQQALDILAGLGENKESFRKLGLTFEEKAFYDILIHLRDKYNFEYGEDKNIGGLIINDKCKALAKKIKELIDVQSSFTDWLNNTNVRAELNQKIFFCLVKAGYPPQYNDEVFEQVMEQVENFKKNK